MAKTKKRGATNRRKAALDSSLFALLFVFTPVTCIIYIHTINKCQWFVLIIGHNYAFLRYKQDLHIFYRCFSLYLNILERLRNEIRQSLWWLRQQTPASRRPYRRDVCVAGFAGLHRWTAELMKPQLACG